MRQQANRIRMHTCTHPPNVSECSGTKYKHFLIWSSRLQNKYESFTVDNGTAASNRFSSLGHYVSIRNLYGEGLILGVTH